MPDLASNPNRLFLLAAALASAISALGIASAIAFAREKDNNSTDRAHQRILRADARGSLPSELAANAQSRFGGCRPSRRGCDALSR